MRRLFFLIESRLFRLLDYCYVNKAQYNHLIVFIFILIAALTGCSLRPTRSYPVSVNAPAFKPPTIVPTPLPTIPPTPTLSEQGNNTTTSCIDILRYIEDITIPDGTEVIPGTTLDKRWRVENNGSCNWENGYTLNLVAGADMGAATVQALYPVRSGSQAILRILLTAPMETGNYRSAWQAHNAAGQPFGDPIYIEINVLDNTTPATTEGEPLATATPEA